MSGAVKCAVGPEGVPDWFSGAVVEGGGDLVPVEEADVLFWYHGKPDGLGEYLRRRPELAWVQLPAAGIEIYADVLDEHRTWTAAKGVYADPVAEHALTLGLAGLRGLGTYARRREWSTPHGTSLFDARVVILGGGGIAEVLLDLLRPFRARVTVVRRHPEPMVGADAVVGQDVLHEVLPGADLVVLALSLTPETTGVIAADELRLMADHAWLVNVSRGGHVVTDDLLTALRDGWIGGAALDVTDPEPLPAGHPLWDLENCIVSPHSGNTLDMHRPLLAAFTRDNLRRFAAGEPLWGLVDPTLGY